MSNLDFVESIFGNAGDPYLPENDAQLDGDSWTGHTGCVILAPHLTALTKREVGLPRVEDATERQKRDGMCWESEDELYNNGSAFKVTCRDRQGVMVTLIADNYFGYCKKEVKTQISYSANLHGLAEEEHAGGAVAFPSYDLGEDFRLSSTASGVDHTYAEVKEAYAGLMTAQPEGHAVDKRFPDIVYVPENVEIDLRRQTVVWEDAGKKSEIRLQAGHTYVLPSGYKIEMVKPGKGRRWRLIGTTAEGVFCHKPCTVSGGGKSEISKSIANAIHGGPVFVEDLHRDFDAVDAIVKRDYQNRFLDPDKNGQDTRPLLSPARSLGSVVKLLTPSGDYNEEHNQWLRQIPWHIRQFALILKRVYNPEWGDQWRRFYSVDVINGAMGKELKYKGNTLVTHYLRIGFTEDDGWRTFSLRKDFHPAAKLQMEDDISASIVAPRDRVAGLSSSQDNPSVKLLVNCENMFFQRPDEAIHRGYDEAAELDFSRDDCFFSNYHPLPRAEAREIIEDVIHFDQFTEPMKRVIQEFVEADKPDYLVTTAEPRRVNGKRTKNPRYLQPRDDLDNPRQRYLAETGLRLYRRIPLGESVPIPVNAVLTGRRNNAADPNAGMKALAVFNPIHFQDLPELFMEFVSSLTGKSPSTTGAGSEGALTKGPFNALPPIHDLNNALVSYALTGYEGFTTSAGCIGPNYRIDHDISLLIPEVWSRMRPEERKARWLIDNGYLEPCSEIALPKFAEHAGRLGYRITEKFVSNIFGRVFSSPDAVVPPDMLRPERQDMDQFLEGMENILATQKRVAQLYFEDNSVEQACPPLKALLHIMVHGRYEGAGLEDASVRELFTRESVLASDWYKERLKAKQTVDRRYWKRQIDYMNAFARKRTHKAVAERLDIAARVETARERLRSVESPDYVTRLIGTLGVDPVLAPDETAAEPSTAASSETVNA